MEAGLTHATTYPGTPASEIGDTFYQHRNSYPMYFEYSVNEKVALEVAAAAAVSGFRAMVSMKHVGVNVAADTLLTMAYLGVVGGLVIVSADDPSCHSSQNEQDNRYYAKLGNLPMLEPSSPQESKEMMTLAFELSERLELPVLLRTTTRVSHMRGPVTYGEMKPQDRRREFQKDPQRWMSVPLNARVRHGVLIEKMAEALDCSETTPLNRIEGAGTLGVITSGAGYNYVVDLVNELGLVERVSILKLGFTHPLPRRKMQDFLAEKEAVLVVEELEPFLEEHLKAYAYDRRIDVPIYGKESGHFERVLEYNPDTVRRAFMDLKELEGDISPIHRARASAVRELPAMEPAEMTLRPPVLCSGCPHTATYYAVKIATGGDAIFPSDIGCYTLGYLPPISSADFNVSMGASVGVAGGFATVSKKTVVAFIGDSTFFHAGLPGLVNAVHHKIDFTLVILDNRATAMTGNQPHPGACREEAGANELVEISIERIVRGLGVDDVRTVDPYDVNTTAQAVRDAVGRTGVSVIISRHTCSLMEIKLRQEPAGKFQVETDRCRVCGLLDSREGCSSQKHPLQELHRSRGRLEHMPPNPMEGLADKSLSIPKHWTAPCTLSCPADICVPGYMALTYAGRYSEALDLIRERIPIPASVGRLCHRPCETECSRGGVDEPVAINRIKRFLADAVLTDKEVGGRAEKLMRRRLEQVVPKRGKVAVVGSGPAGLAAAYDLRFRGYEVTIFEAEERVGGMLGLAVPECRLPYDVIRAEVSLLESAGIRIETGREVGRDIELAELEAAGFDAFFIGVGSRFGLPLGMPGEDLPEIMDALEFLKSAKRGDSLDVGKKVMVVGGGDTAVDAARVARRLGAESVTILYRRSRDEMPAGEDELTQAEAEGVEIETLAVPARLAEGTDGGVEVVCMRTALHEPDESGRPRPVPISGSEFSVEADRVIVAIGQQVDAAFLSGAYRPEFNRDGTIRVDPETGVTSVPNLYAGGDVVTGPLSVIEAIAGGKRAAYGIDRFLSGQGEAVAPHNHSGFTEGAAEVAIPTPHVPARRRTPPRRIPVEERGGFTEVDSGYDEQDARAEVERCLACGLCAKCSVCIDNFFCPAICEEDGLVRIDEEMCIGCSVCAQICPNNAIVAAR